MTLDDDIHALSRRFAPPVIDLREGRILDDWGHEDWATRAISHRLPSDVSKEDLDFYHDVFPFLERPDLLFYLWSVWRIYLQDPRLEAVDFYLYTLDTGMKQLRLILDDSSACVIQEALRSMYARWPDFADFDGCGRLGPVARGQTEL